MTSRVLDDEEAVTTRAAACPFVSVIMPVLDEERWIERSLASVLDQDYPAEAMEVLVVDGGSEDRTVELALAADDARVSVLHNTRRHAPAALNLGVAKARGDLIVRVDGHCELAGDYLRRCVDTLAATGADCVGGPWETVGDGRRGRAIARALSSPFGVGNVAFRVQRATPGPVDTVPLGAWPRDAFERFGGFDEDLVRNQDDELAFRINQRGGTVWYEPSIRSRYHCRRTLPELWRQYEAFGRYKVAVAVRRGGFASWRHLVPGTFVAAVATTTAWGLLRRRWTPFAAIVVPYVTASGVAARRASRSATGTRTMDVALAFLVLHTAYGIGFWRGVADLAAGRLRR